MELDHIYICVGEKAPEGDALVEFGLVEGSSNTHPGQGTANRRFFFHNFMLELLWCVDPAEVRAKITRPIRLHEALLSPESDASRFGMGFRAENGDESDAPFPFVHYRPKYLPEPLSVQTGSQRPATEPNYFFLNFVQRPDPAEIKEPINHPNGLRFLTSVKVWLQQEVQLSDTAKLVSSLPGVEIDRADEQLIELEFDHGEQGLRRDFRPVLPLVITG
ncbi:MAG: hypothetical protein ACNI3A_15945 [Desulfovibrio sp.]|uniref:hypothetical protein n=1 Tax=Desulfovibrio sp. 7SRBS1 TaxID=3378064 RepID=UPI003B3D07D0